MANKKSNVKKNNKARALKVGSSEWEFPLNKTDLIWLGIGVIVVALGYLLMATGITEEPALEQGTWNNNLAVNVAPVVLFIGYVVIIPMALFKFFSRRKKTSKEVNEYQK
jgi:hypothetical protein